MYLCLTLKNLLLYEIVVLEHFDFISIGMQCFHYELNL